MKSAGAGVAVTALPAGMSLAREAAPSQPFTFVQICDTQLGMGGYEHDLATFRQAVAQVNILKPDFVVLCGDLVHDANAPSFADFKKIRAALEMPSYCVPGNHDIGGTPSRESLQTYRNLIGPDSFSFEHKGSVFVFVNTQLWKTTVEGESAKHDAWLQQTLETAAQTGSNVFIIGHIPLFLKRPDEAEEYMNLPPAKRNELLGLFERCGVVAVLGGHAHRLIINDYKGIQLVNGETTSKNFDQRPFGFRVWHVTEPRPFRHELVPLDAPSAL